MSEEPRCLSNAELQTAIDSLIAFCLTRARNRDDVENEIAATLIALLQEQRERAPWAQ